MFILLIKLVISLSHGHHLLLFVTFIWFAWKIMLQYRQHLSFLKIYRWYFIRENIGDNVLFDPLNSYHANIKLVTELKTQSLPTSVMPINSVFTAKTENYLHYELPKLQNTIIEMHLMVIFIVEKEIH